MQAPVITKTLLVSLRKAVKLRSRKHSSHYRKTNTARSCIAVTSCKGPMVRLY